MKGILLLLLVTIVFVTCHHENEHEHTPHITKEFIENLKSVAPFEVIDYENHPFKDWSVADLKYKLGLLRRPGPRRQIPYGVGDDIPEEFDSRKEWPDCIHPIRDQKSCGSCWAFAASEALSDRLCIASKGKVKVTLSPQELVSCDKNDFGCDGGYVDKSWDYILENGLVTDECYPYTSGSGSSGSCKITKKKKCPAKGVEFKKYKVSVHHQHETIAEAQQKIMAGGPIEAAFDVYDDFMNYSSGVYKRTSDNLLGGHAVKVVGWGKDKEAGDYWIVANSWNTGWGEKGFFRIAFGECNFEGDLWSGKAQVEDEPEDRTDNN